MKNQKELRIVSVFKRVFNVRAWIDYDRMRAFTVYLFTGIKKMVVPAKQDVDNTDASFKEAMAAMNITEQELDARRKGLYRLCWLMSALALGLFGYSIYQIIYGSFKAFIVSLVIALIAVVLAFRYHFWYFQIKERRLGCTIRDWYRKGFLGEK